MRRAYKITAVLIAVLMMLALLSGCAADVTELMFLDDGSVQYSNSRYVSEAYITGDAGTTPQEMFKDKIAEGGTLDWIEINGEKYWGMAPVVSSFDSYDDLQKTVDQAEGVSLSIRTDGGRQYATFECEIPSKDEGLDEFGDENTDPSLADIAVVRIRLRFPGGIRGISGVDERHVRVYSSDGGEIVETDLFAGEYSYTASFSGWLEGTTSSEIENVELTVGEIIGGLSTPSSVRVSVDDGIGGVDPSTQTVKWFMKNAAGTWDRVGDDEVFQAGEVYSFDYFVFTRKGYTISEGVSASYNGIPSNTEFGTIKNSDNCIYISGSFGPLEGEVTDKTIIETVYVSIDPPEAGKTAKDLKYKVYSVPENALDQSKTTVIWYRSSSKSTQSSKWVEVKEGEPFYVGYFYSPDIFLYPANGYGFSPLTTGQVNGYPSDNYFGSFFKSDKELYLSRMFDAVGGTPFTDVSGTDYFKDAVYWAYNSCPQITDGTSRTTFSPTRTCTRGQVVTFLWRAMGEPEPVTTTNPFTDVKASDYFYKPVLWAVEQGITDGTSPTSFSPGVTCRNNHILTFIWRAVGRPGDTGAEKTQQWYQDALDWAVSNRLLDGTFTGDFNVNGDCPRANVVEYLYRYSGMR